MTSNDLFCFLGSCVFIVTLYALYELSFMIIIIIIIIIKKIKIKIKKIKN